MVELAPGSRVFLYQSNIDIAAKKTTSAAACFLLSCFFPNSELIGANLTGANGKKKLPSQIIDAIVGKHSTNFHLFSNRNITSTAQHERDERMTCIYLAGKCKRALFRRHANDWILFLFFTVLSICSSVCWWPMQTCCHPFCAAEQDHSAGSSTADRAKTVTNRLFDLTCINNTTLLII